MSIQDHCFGALPGDIPPAGGRLREFLESPRCVQFYGAGILPLVGSEGSFIYSFNRVTGTFLGMLCDAMIGEQLRCTAVSMEAKTPQAVGRRIHLIKRRLARCNVTIQSSSYPANDSNRIHVSSRRSAGQRSFEPGFELGRPSATVAELSSPRPQYPPNLVRFWRKIAAKS